MCVCVERVREENVLFHIQWFFIFFNSYKSFYLTFFFFLNELRIRVWSTVENEFSCGVMIWRWILTHWYHRERRQIRLTWTQITKNKNKLKMIACFDNVLWETNLDRSCVCEWDWWLDREVCVAHIIVLMFYSDITRANL